MQLDVSDIMRQVTIKPMRLCLLCLVFLSASEMLSIIYGYYTKTPPYQPTWDSLDTRPNPAWYDEAKFGIFIHWGVFSVPSFGSEWFWWNWQGAHQKPYINFMKSNYKPGFVYPDFGADFTAEFYDPDHWADVLDASGAKYVVLTSKHHEGYTLWPSNYSWNWNAKDVGPARDVLGALASSIRSRTDIRFGLYYSLYEWFNPLYLMDKSNKYTTNKYMQFVVTPQLQELVYEYEPDVVWTDGDWETNSDYWNATNFLAWLYNDSPIREKVVTNDRWGHDARCHHGGFYTCDDRYNPGKLLSHKWENCMTIDKKSWGFRREATLEDYLDIEDLIKLLAETVSCGGNLLMNIGPTHDGRILPVFEERLRDMGSWLGVNGEAIYSSKPWMHQNDSVTKGVWYTMKPSTNGTNVYAIMLKWAMDNQVILGSVEPDGIQSVTMLGYNKPLHWTHASEKGILVTLPTLNSMQMPCKWAWVLKIGMRKTTSKELWHHLIFN